MKKILLLTLSTVLLCALAFTQETKTEVVKKNLFSVSAGPAFPVGDFAATDLTNDKSGLAKTGVLINANYSHHLDKIFAITADLNYARHSIDNTQLQPLSADHWQYFNLMVGPMVTADLSRGAAVDLSVLSGVAYANMPKVFDGLEATQEDWSFAVPVKVNLDLRFDVSRNMFIKLSGNYNYLEAKFNANGTSHTQRMDEVGVLGGIGFHF